MIFPKRHLVIPLNRLAVLLWYFAVVSVGRAQTPAPLPPEAQTAVDKGVLVAKQQDYLLAVRYFQDARKLAPQAPEVYFDLGLAESKIPGRELRAIAWFGAYLAANPNAPNAAAVKEQIDVLDVKSQTNISHLIQSVQDAAMAVSHIGGDLYESTNGNKFSHGSDDHANFQVVAQLWAMAGDITAAMKVADLIPVGGGHDPALNDIAEAQADAGDIAGAQKTIYLIKDVQYKSFAQARVARAQAEAGDTAGAQNTAALIQDPGAKDSARGYINTAQVRFAEAQTRAGNIAGAQKTIDLLIIKDITSPTDMEDLAKAQADAGDIVGAQKTADVIQDAGSKDWAKRAIENASVKLAEAQANAGDIADAQKTIDLIKETAPDRDMAELAKAQANAGDIAGAVKTADLIRDPFWKRFAQGEINFAQAKIRSTNVPVPANSLTTATQASVQLGVTHWLTKLDDGSQTDDCPLNTDPFLDLAGYLKSLPTSDKPETVFNSLRVTARKIITARNVIDQMLKQQAGK